jgi:hypothetical protein
MLSPRDQQVRLPQWVKRSGGHCLIVASGVTLAPDALGRGPATPAPGPSSGLVHCKRDGVRWATDLQGIRGVGVSTNGRLDMARVHEFSCLPAALRLPIAESGQRRLRYVAVFGQLFGQASACLCMARWRCGRQSATGRRIKCGEPSGGTGQPNCPAPFFIDPTPLFEGVPCLETSSGTASITATAGLGHHPSSVIKEIRLTVSRFRLSGTDRRNNAVALIR